MAITEEYDAKISTINLDQVEGNVSFKNIAFSDDDKTEVLHDISFEALKGSVTALVGSSGSGKSTIAGLATAFLNPNSGQVLIDGVDLSKVNLKSFRSQLGVVLQDDFLYEGTIRENILFPRPDAVSYTHLTLPTNREV